MIKLLKSSFSKDKNISNLSDTADILTKLGYSFETIVADDTMTTWDIDVIIKNNLDKFKKDDVIVLDDYKHHSGKPHSILKKYNHLNFLVFCYDISDTENEILYYNSKNNIKSVTAMVYDLKKIDSFNYYSWNVVNSQDFNTSKYLFDSFGSNLKEKKFIFANGFLRWDRYLTYQSLLMNNNIDSGWVSFSQKYNYGQSDWSFFENQLKYFQLDNSNIDKTILNALKNKIPFSFDRDVNIDYLDYNPRLELLYRLNSYVGIVNETMNNNSLPFYTSEKLWKPFCCFQIPFIIGNEYIKTWLKNIGFDLFEDIFTTNDLDYTNKITQKDLVKTQLNSLNNFLSKPKEEIHKIYSKNKWRLINNYNKMIEFVNNQEEDLKQYI